MKQREQQRDTLRAVNFRNAWFLFIAVWGALALFGKVSAVGGLFTGAWEMVIKAIK